MTGGVPSGGMGGGAGVSLGLNNTQSLVYSIIQSNDDDAGASRSYIYGTLKGKASENQIE